MRFVLRVIRFEAALWRSLFLLVTGRRDGVPSGAVAFSYHRPVTPVWLTFAGVSAVELVAVELLVPWPPVRAVLLVLGVWSLLLVLGMWAGMVVRPYVVSRDGVRLRHGTRRDVRLGAASIVAVRTRTARDWGSGGLGADVVVRQDRGHERVGYVVGGETHVVLTLADPESGTDRADGADDTRPREVHIGLDDPTGFVAAVNRLLGVPAAR